MWRTRDGVAEESKCSGGSTKRKGRGKKEKGSSKRAAKLGKHGEWHWVLLIDTPERGRANATQDATSACPSSVSQGATAAAGQNAA